MSADFRYLWHLLTTELGVHDPTHKQMKLAEKIRLRRERVTEFMAGLSSWAEIEETMDKMNIAWGRVRNAATIQDQPTVRARGAIVEIDDRAGGTRPVTQSPYRFSNAKSGVRGPAPHRGEHNRAVLTEWLDKSSLEIDALFDACILQHDPETTTGKDKLGSE